MVPDMPLHESSSKIRQARGSHSIQPPSWSRTKLRPGEITKNEQFYGSRELLIENVYENNHVKS